MFWNGWRQKKPILSGFKICHLVGRRNMSFGRESKYVMCLVVEICRLVRRRNMSFGHAMRYVICSGRKMVRIFHLDGLKTFHLVGYWKLSIGYESKYVIWSMSLGQASEYLKYSYIRRNYIIFFVLIPIKNLCMWKQYLKNGACKRSWEQTY